MADLNSLKRRADQSQRDFESSCKAHGYSDHWGAYRREETWPAELFAAHAKMVCDLHRYYEARDGSQGFLGGKGL